MSTWLHPRPIRHVGEFGHHVESVQESLAARICHVQPFATPSNDVFGPRATPSRRERIPPRHQANPQHEGGALDVSSKVDILKQLVRCPLQGEVILLNCCEHHISIAPPHCRCMLQRTPMLLHCRKDNFSITLARVCSKLQGSTILPYGLQHYLLVAFVALSGALKRQPILLHSCQTSFTRAWLRFLHGRLPPPCLKQPNVGGFQLT
mmetsp:Transcript_24832/g.45565  ORF Transcript_24832/g.45565 Transcript_24832/m.45565 type:complete len:207 (+) Transcript_24832:68-688(+)